MRRFVCAALFAAGVLGLAGQAGAAIQEFDATIDVSGLQVFGTSSTTATGFRQFSGPNSGLNLALGAGDTLVVDFTFSEALTVTGLNSVQSFFSQAEPGGGTSAGGTGTIDLLGAGGATLFATPAQPSFPAPSINVSLNSPPGTFPAGPLTFSGLRFTAPSGLATGDTLNVDRFVITVFASTVTAPDLPAPVPEPATWALMLLGFGAVGCTLRRSRRSAALA